MVGLIKYQDYFRFKDLREAKDYIMAEKGMTDRQAHQYLSEKVPLESYYQRKIIESMTSISSSFSAA